MRIAIIADIHANRIALDAVLADLAAERPDQIVCLGDVAATGPQPREALGRLRGLSCPVVMGNADAWLLNPRADQAPDDDLRRIEEIDRWCAEQLSPDDRDYVSSFCPTVELPLGDRASLLCYHGSPCANTDIIRSTTPDEELEPMLAGFHALVMAGGHTHVQMFRRYHDVVLINPGSVGLPFERDPSTGRTRNPPWAEYAVVEWAQGGLSVDLRRVRIDTAAIARAALGSGMPYADWWAKDWSIE